MRRRVWLTAMLLTAVGCSGKSTKSRAKTTKSSRPARKNPKGAKTTESSRPARNNKAVPLLEKMATDKDGKVSAAAKQALVSIRK